MRAPFDRLVDTFTGPDTPTPYAPLLVAMPARLVPDQAFQDIIDPLNQSLAYLTYDAGYIGGPVQTALGGQFYNVAYGKADLVALITGGPVTHQAVRIETRTWPTGTNYSRAHLIPRQDVPPSVCSTSYPPTFELWFGASYQSTLLRIGPTSWEGDGWLLLGEVDGPPDGTCHSLWRLYRSGHIWETDYNGQVNQLFISPDGGLPTAISVHPIP